MRKSTTADEIIGWYGSGAIILAYALVSFNTLTSDSVVYQLLNGTGAFGLIWISLLKRAYQPLALNVVWFAIAVIALVSMLT